MNESEFINESTRDNKYSLSGQIISSISLNTVGV